MKDINLDDLLLVDLIKGNPKCFCGIDKKAFDCCLKRNEQLGDCKNRIKSTLKSTLLTDCYFPNRLKKENCYPDMNAHTISKSKNLDGFKWLTFHNGNYHRSGYIMKPHRANKVSTFRGFCGYHDNKFSDTDNNLFNDSAIHQQAFRQLCYELSSKKKSIVIKEQLFNLKVLIINNLKNKEYEKSIDDYLKREVNMIYQMKMAHDLLLKNDFNDFNNSFKNEDLIINESILYYKEISLKESFAMNISSIYSPEKNLYGIKFKEPFKNIYFFVLYNKKNPKLIMACNKKDLEHKEYINSFFLSNDLEGLILKHSILFENVFFEEKFYKELSKKTKDEYQFLYLKHNELLWEKECDLFKDLELNKPIKITK